MTDRELLELAAKAEGHKVYFDDGKSDLAFYDSKYTGLLWNPIHVNEDAFKLMVKLSINVSSEKCNGTTWICMSEIQINESHNNDPYAATRRAIVRAAAEIGRNMQ